MTTVYPVAEPAPAPQTRNGDALLIAAAVLAHAMYTGDPQRQMHDCIRNAARAAQQLRALLDQ